MSSDIFYYSNHCKHSQKILNTLVKKNIVKELNCISVDKRKINMQTGQINVELENGSMVMLPPNVHSVPALLLIKENYRVLFGNEIIDFFKKYIADSEDNAVQGNGEPQAFFIGNTNSKDIHSEKYTFYNASPEDLSTKGLGGNRPLYNYIPANGESQTINTPPETYKSEKMPDVTIDSIQEKRNSDMNQSMNNHNSMPFLPK